MHFKIWQVNSHFHCIFKAVFVSAFGYLSRSKRSSLDVLEGGGHSGWFCHLFTFLQLYNCFHCGGKLIAVRVTGYLQRNVLMHCWKNTVLLNVASRKKGEHLKTCPK